MEQFLYYCNELNNINKYLYLILLIIYLISTYLVTPYDFSNVVKSGIPTTRLTLWFDCLCLVPVFGLCILIWRDLLMDLMPKEIDEDKILLLECEDSADVEYIPFTKLGM